MLFEKYDTFIGVVIECKGIRYWVNCGNEMFKVVCKANLAKGEKVLFGVTNYKNIFSAENSQSERGGYSQSF